MVDLGLLLTVALVGLAAEAEVSERSDEAPDAAAPAEVDTEASGEGDAEAEAPEEDDTTSGVLNYQFASAQRVVVSDGPTRVSAESNTPAPARGGFALRAFVDNAAGPQGTLELVFHQSGQTARRAIELGAGERRVVDLPLLSTMRAGSLTAAGVGTSPGSEVARVVFQSVYSPQRVVLALGQPKDFERFIGRSPSSAEEATTLVTTIPADEAPSELAAYTGYDAVVLPQAQGLEGLHEGQRRALEAYAATGGTLVLKAPQGGLTSLPLLTSREAGVHPYGFGRLGLYQDAEWAVTWPARPVVEPRGMRGHSWDAGSAQRLVPLLPQATAPVGRFLLIIGVFTLVIGPGSIMVARRRGPTALLFTIPATALVTCVAIVSYSLLADGFTLHASSYGLTLLDARNHRAITVGVNAYYANLAPRHARYASMTALMAPAEREERGALDMTWSDGLTVGGGFIPSRLYQEWGLMAVEPTRARLRVEKRGAGWVVQNALGSALSFVSIELDDGRWFATGVPEGGEATLRPRAEPPALPPMPAERFGPDALAMVVSGAEPDEAKASTEPSELAPEPGQFVAVLGGAGFVPSGGLTVSLEEGVHYVRGVVER